jgi:hypothetical protein
MLLLCWRVELPWLCLPGCWMQHQLLGSLCMLNWMQHQLLGSLCMLDTEAWCQTAAEAAEMLQMVQRGQAGQWLEAVVAGSSYLRNCTQPAAWAQMWVRPLPLGCMAWQHGSQSEQHMSAVRTQQLVQHLHTPAACRGNVSARYADGPAGSV